MKSNSVVTYTISDGVITFRVIGAGELTLRMSDLAPVILERARDFGMVQRIMDKAAIPRDTSTGKSATPAEKYAAMKGLVDHYSSGSAEWSRKREPVGKRGGKNGRLLLQALQEYYPGRSVEALTEYLAARSEIEQDALLICKELKPIVDRLRAASVASVDTISLLGELL